MVLGADKTIPSFVFVKDDGEIWQLAHDSQETICWKCGGLNHIGSRCRERAVSLDGDLLAGNDGHEAAEAPVQTWAHVVRRGTGLPDDRHAEDERNRLAEAERVRLAEVERVRLENERNMFDEAERVRLAEDDKVRQAESVRLVEVERLRLEEAERVRQLENVNGPAVEVADGANDFVMTDVDGLNEADVTRQADKDAAAGSEPIVVEDLVDKQSGIVADKFEAVIPVAGHAENIESYVSIKDPSDNIITSAAKLARNDDGSPVPSSTGAVFGTSPELPHKEAVRFPQLVYRPVSQLSGGLQGLGGGFSDLKTSNETSSEVEEASTPRSELATSNSLVSSFEGDLEGGNISPQ